VLCFHAVAASGSAGLPNRGRADTLFLDSQPGDFIGGGIQQTFTAGHFSLSGAREASRSSTANGLSRFWELSFIAPEGAGSIRHVRPGGRYNFQSATLPAWTSTGTAEDATCCPDGSSSRIHPRRLGSVVSFRRLRAALRAIARGALRIDTRELQRSHRARISVSGGAVYEGDATATAGAVTVSVYRGRRVRHRQFLRSTAAQIAGLDTRRTGTLTSLTRARRRYPAVLGTRRSKHGRFDVALDPRPDPHRLRQGEVSIFDNDGRNLVAFDSEPGIGSSRIS